MIKIIMLYRQQILARLHRQSILSQQLHPVSDLKMYSAKCKLTAHANTSVGSNFAYFKMGSPFLFSFT